MPADPSSPIRSGLSPLCDTDPLRPAEPPDLLAYLATIPDPRARTGRRHPLVAILGLAAAAVLAGARSMVAIAEWAADAPQPVLAALGARRDPLTGHFAVPAEATIRRTLARLDAEALAAVVGAWLADRAGRHHHDRRRRAVAVDGKTLRGARYPPDGRQVHLLAAMDHATRAVLAQRQVDGAPGEVPGLRPLLADLDLAGTVVTADALHTHADAAEFLVTRKQADYLFCVKANQPILLARCAALAWRHVPVLDRTRDRGHGRVELRNLKAVSVGHFGLPHAAQVLQVTRKVRKLHARWWRTVTVYAITSLPFERARPARLADLVRGHWAIETAYLELKSSILGGRVLRARTPQGIDQEVYALLVCYQLLRLAMADATSTHPGIDPDRASFTIALHTARDQLIQAAGVIASATIDLVGKIGRRVLDNLLPDRRLRVSPRIVKRAISKYNARGPTINRTSYKATVSIHILSPPARLTTRASP